MEFLKDKFSDVNNHLRHFLDKDNGLRELETDPSIAKSIKSDFVNAFVNSIVSEGMLPASAANCLPDTNPWSIDFPSWIGSFDEAKGKNVMVIGAEPHIHFEYLQNVYHFNNSHSTEFYLNSAHSIFQMLAALVSARLHITPAEALHQCYLTDLFPMSPFRGNGLSVGTAHAIQAAIGNDYNWYSIRHSYAKKYLPKEITAVKPTIIITQGVTVLKEVISILEVTTPIKNMVVKPDRGKSHYVRKTDYKGIPIISVPHIGSSRLRAFWNKNLKEVEKIFAEI